MNAPQQLPTVAGQAVLPTFGLRRRHHPRALLRRLAGMAHARPDRRSAHRKAVEISHLDRMIDLFEHTTCDCA